MRVEFENQLNRLNEKLVELSELCATQVKKAANALLEKSTDLCEEVITTEKEVNNLSSIIEQQCIRIILTEQPVASDLRFISAAMKMNTDLERIGDQAEDIAFLVKQMIEQGYRRRELGSVREMSVKAAEMTQDAVRAFADGDSHLASSTIQQDDEVDALFSKVRDEVILEIRAQGEHDPVKIIDILMISKYLERIGDHAENIAESVLYSLTGSYEVQN